MGRAGLPTLASFLITRLGNVPFNGEIKEWALASAPADHAEILRRRDLFNNLRTLTALTVLTAFALLIVLPPWPADHAGRTDPVRPGPFRGPRTSGWS
ncbi:hypothetical protein [Streptomyces avidinii]|uniref:Uncharacterized protein n=1 Tax=Streptomyces avidinii TaxID=1895 RepID=A0ABS4KZ43_STRAV|nr:hypothetical protein [Streptomyces avidinii]MBP2034781.1 hypothetical protein [Streptomyces avidinii]GGY88818.1 hypothetical protein GCM10010343_12480 [Streptomyces avidinii]